MSGLTGKLADWLRRGSDSAEDSGNSTEVSLSDESPRNPRGHLGRDPLNVRQSSILGKSSWSRSESSIETYVRLSERSKRHARTSAAGGTAKKTAANRNRRDARAGTSERWRGSGSTLDDSGRSCSYDTCGPYDLPQKRSQEPTFSEDPKLTESPNYHKTRPPSFPEFATLGSRLRSYDLWPISLKLKPNVLSEAGFFYTGKGDQTICYHCGGGLKDWEETDEPWVEHARWFSKCPFVISLKGKDFVEEVCGKKAEEDLMKCTPHQLNGLTSSSSTGDLEKVPTYVPQTVKSQEEGKSEEISPSSSSTCSRSSSRGSSDVLLCKICYTEEVGAVFLPCGHMLACVKCALSLSSCAICRKPVSAFFRAFFS